MKYTLKAWLIDNRITKDDPNDKILLLESAGNLTLQDVLDQMKKEDTGLRPETIAHVVSLYQRVVSGLVLNGYGVNTGLFRAVPQFRGLIENGKWDTKKNSVYVSFTQDKELREAITETSVDILGEKGDVMYLVGGEDAATRAEDGTATAGRNYTLMGNKLKVEGTNSAVGITLTNSAGTVTKLPLDHLVVNKPSQLIILLPASLADGDYTLTVTTQYSGSGNKPLKLPRSVKKVITIGKDTGGNSGGNSGGNTGGNGKDDNSLG